MNSHSGDIRLLVPAGVGFELEANTFSGSLRSDLPLTLRGATRPETERDDDDTPRGRRNSQSLRGTFGDGSAIVTVRTFSGDVVITRR